MRLGIVFTVLGQHDLARLAIQHALENCTDSDTQIYVIDNGGDFTYPEYDSAIEIIHPGNNIGVYPVFEYAMERTAEDVLLFLHSDLIIDEKGFDDRLLKAFEVHPKLGLVGFVGSNEIDAAGGRGGGTTSNFQGKTYYSTALNWGKQWTGSPAEAHGKRSSGYTPAAVVDGCAMVIRRTAWEKIGYREGFPLFHFYDRLISTQMLEAGFKVAVLGIACDHISGQTVSREDRYNDLARDWCMAHVSPDKFAGNPPNYAWDQTLYQAAEREWLAEYRDRKHIVPIKV